MSNSPVRTMTRPQIIANQILDSLGVSYRNEEPFTYYSVDNYLPEYNLIIEVMGDYWHSSPLKYDDKINEKQKHIISRDKAKRTYIKNSYGISILYLWEYDLINRPDVCERLIKIYIESRGVLDNYNSFNYNLSDSLIFLNENIIKPFQEL